MNNSTNPRKGQKYGQWLLKKTLGEGGNGFVFLANNDAGNEVAIKILAKVEGKSSKVYERFKREVRVIQNNYDISGLLPILDSYLPDNLSNGFPWYVMPVAEPLNHYLTNQSIENIVKAVLEVGKTLIHLHNRGISHRDIKPANILVKENCYFLADFGLVDVDDGLDLTSTGEQIGAKWTIAPEMKRASHQAVGKPADVYSLSKTLWILITGKKDGFDGQYDPESINGLKNYNLYVPEENGIYYLKPRNIYLKPLDDLLRESTDNNPNNRPIIEDFVNRLTVWLGLYKNFYKRNPLEWKDVQERLFPFATPSRAIWSDINDIVKVLNYICSIQSLNHTLLPKGGGMDIEGAKVGLEDGTIELIIGDRHVYITKPKRLIFESFGADWEWNYFRLENEELEPIREDYTGRYPYEELVEIEPLFYIGREHWDYGEYEGERLPEKSRLVCRYIKGDFIIIQKTSTYNRISYTYDGRHNQMNTDEFRAYIAEKVAIVQNLRKDDQVMQLAEQDGSDSVDDFIYFVLDKIFRKEYLERFSGNNTKFNQDFMSDN